MVDTCGSGRRGERREAHAGLAISGTLSYTHPQTPVTFDAVVVQCFCHGGQSLLPCVTIGDQLEETNVSFPPSLSCGKCFTVMLNIKPTHVYFQTSNLLLLHIMNHFSTLYINVCLYTMYVGVASFPGTTGLECEHGNHAGGDSLVSFLT